MSGDSSAILQQAKNNLTDAYKKSGMGWNDYLIEIGARRKDEPPMAEPTAGATTPAGETGMFSGLKNRVSGIRDSVNNRVSGIKNPFAGVEMKNPFAGGPGIDWSRAAVGLFSGGRKSKKQQKSRKQGKKSRSRK